jgi:predicted DNA-binding transcriptional regulator AlpA
MQPRLIRLRDAPKYLGMDRNRFNSEVRPFLITLKIGQQGIAFDRIDLDQWADEFKQQHAKPVRNKHWPENDIQPSLKKAKQSIRIKKSIDEEFQQLVNQLSMKK